MNLSGGTLELGSAGIRVGPGHRKALVPQEQHSADAKRLVTLAIVHHCVDYGVIAILRANARPATAVVRRVGYMAEEVAHQDPDVSGRAGLG